MKARIKKTGEIIKVADYAKIVLDKCDSYGTPIEMRPEEVELIDDVSEDSHWQDVRERAAIAAMQGMMANSELLESTGFSGTYYKWHIERKAVEYANALVEQLKKK